MVKLCFFVGSLISGGLLGGFAAIVLSSPVPASPVSIGAIIGAIYAAFRLGAGELTGKVAAGCFFVGATAFGGVAGFLIGLAFDQELRLAAVGAGLLVGAVVAAFGIGKGSLARATQPTAYEPLPPLGFFATLNRVLLCSAVGSGAVIVASSAFPVKWTDVRAWAVASNLTGSTVLFDHTIEHSVATAATAFFIPAFLGSWFFLAIWRRMTTRARAAS